MAANTPFPTLVEAITAANASQIRELARYGEPAIFTFDTQVSSDGKRAFISTAAGIRIYDQASHQQIGLIDAVTARPHLPFTGYSTFLVNYDGSRLVILTLQDIRIVDDHNQLLLVLPYPDDSRDSGEDYVEFSLSSDASLLAFSSRYRSILKVWDIAKNELVFEQAGFSPLFLGSGLKLAYKNADTGWVDIHDLSTGETSTLKTNQRSSFKGFKASPDGILLGVIGNDQVEVWNVPDARLVKLIRSLPNATSATIALSSEQNYLVHNESSKTINVYDLANGKRISSVERPGLWSVLFVSLTAQGEPLVDEFFVNLLQNKLKWLRLLDFNSSRTALLYTAEMPYDSIYSACIYRLWENSQCETSDNPLHFDQDGQIYTLLPNEQEDYTLYAGQGVQGKLVLTLPASLFIFPLYISTSQEYFLYFNSDRRSPQVELWSIPEQRSLQRWLGMTQSLFISPDGHYLAMILSRQSGNGMWGNYLLVYDQHLNEIVYTEDGDYLLVDSLTFSGDSLRLLFLRPTSNTFGARGLRLRVLDLQSATVHDDLILDMPNNYYDDDSLTAVALSPDSQLLAIATKGGLIRLIDPVDGTAVHEWVAHQAGINRLFFSPEGRLLVSAAIDPNIGDDGLIRVWGVIP